MAVSIETHLSATDFELCVWLWATPDMRLETSTRDGCWLVRIVDGKDRARVVDAIRVPTKRDWMPDFTHPDWPVARAALERLRNKMQ